MGASDSRGGGAEGSHGVAGRKLVKVRDGELMRCCMQPESGDLSWHYVCADPVSYTTSGWKGSGREEGHGG
jgi:hypothetical protein